MGIEIDLQLQIDNIFDITLPDIYTCEVEGLSGEYPVLWVRAYTVDRKQHTNFAFRGAKYFSGPTQWVSANFCVASSAERGELLDELGWTEGASPDHLEELFRHIHLLFVDSRSPRYRIRILTSSAYIEPDVPIEFRH